MSVVAHSVGAMPEWSEILSAVTSVRPDDPDLSRARLRAVWDELDESAHAQRCVIAHYAADLARNLDDEVRWDEAALAAYSGVEEDDLTPVGIPSSRGLAPSLHLNLADGYLRQGRLGESRRHFRAATAALPVLGDDAYGHVVRDGLAGVAERLGLAEDAGGAPTAD